MGGMGGQLGLPHAPSPEALFPSASRQFIVGWPGGRLVPVRACCVFAACYANLSARRGARVLCTRLVVV